MNISAKMAATELMQYVDEINMDHGGEGTKMYSTAGTNLKKVCLQNRLKLLNASVRHLGTDINLVVLGQLYDELKSMWTSIRVPCNAVLSAWKMGDTEYGAMTSLMTAGNVSYL